VPGHSRPRKKGLLARLGCDAVNDYAVAGPTVLEWNEIENGGGLHIGNCFDATENVPDARHFRRRAVIPRAPRAPSLSVSCRRPFDACNAGARPNTMPVSSEMAPVYNSVFASMEKCM